jgi:hypothetical protein
LKNDLPICRFADLPICRFADLPDAAVIGLLVNACLAAQVQALHSVTPAKAGIHDCRGFAVGLYCIAQVFPGHRPGARGYPLSRV